MIYFVDFINFRIFELKINMMKENNYPKCPCCKSNTNVVMNGIIVRSRKKEIIKEEQRYLCKNCKINFFDDTNNAIVDKQRQALMMYLEGMRFSEIGEFLDVDRGTVKKWFSTFGIDLRAIQPLRNLRIKESKQIEEVHTIAIRNNNSDYDVSDHNPNDVYSFQNSYIKDYKQQSFNDGFIILERKKRVHISFLKENQKYTMELRDKSISNKENKKNRKSW
jgi:transposase-like protein